MDFDDETLLNMEAPPVEVRALISRIGDRTIHENLDLVVSPPPGATSFKFCET